MLNEKYYQNKLIGFFKKQNKKIILDEVSFKRKRIDVVHYNEGKITCVEVKIKDWKNAIDQASKNNLFCDNSFIAIPKENSHNVDKDLLEKLNIGLISISENGFIKEKLPKNNKFKIEKYYREFKNKIVNYDEN